MATALPAYHRQLGAAELRPVYLIAGAEPLLVLEAADALRARAKELGYLEREVLDVEANFDWNRLGDAGRALSLFASRKLIDLRLPSGRPGREGAAAIQAFCAAPPPDTVLLVTANDWSRKHEGAWSAAIEKAGSMVVAWPLKLEELPGWIGARMASRGLKATPDAVRFLAERVEGNLLAAAQEIDKLALLHAGATLDAAMLEASVADDARYDVFRLADAAIGGDAARALHIVAGLREEGEEIIPLMGWMLMQLRILARLSAAGADLARAMRAERIWPAAREALFRRALNAGGAEHWERCIAQAGRIDAMAKGRPPGDAWRELERLVAAIAAPRQARVLLT
jgi:DNA polymerase-3 subunit delta